MRKILIALAMLVAMPAFAFTIPESEGKVTDNAHVLTKEQKAALVQKLEKIEKDRSDHPQIGILTVSALPEEGIEELANQTFHSWGIGQKDVDNGLLLVVAPNQRKMRLEVGYGLEPYIPDGVAAKIIDGMKVSLRKQQYYAAFDGAIDGMVKALPEQRVTQLLTAPPTPKKEDPKVITDRTAGHIGLIFFMIGTVIIGIAVVRYFREEKRLEDEANEERRKQQERTNKIINDGWSKVKQTTEPTIDTSKVKDYVSKLDSQKRWNSTVYNKTPTKTINGIGTGVAAGVAIDEVARAAERRRQEEADRRRREADEEDARRRRRRDEESSSSSSSWGSSSSGSSWDSSSSDSGSSWGSGDSGGGGASGDW